VLHARLADARSRQMQESAAGVVAAVRLDQARMLSFQVMAALAPPCLATVPYVRYVVSPIVQCLAVGCFNALPTQ
jgi:hypothetical protein